MAEAGEEIFYEKAPSHAKCFRASKNKTNPCERLKPEPAALNLIGKYIMIEKMWYH